MSELANIIGDYPAFLEDILGRVTSKGFDFNDFSQIDHMCYRTTSLDNYAQKKTELASVARLLGETIVNERPISTFRLNEPVIHESWRIDAVELPAPKAGRQDKEGLEHIEFILFDDFPTFLKKYEGKPFEMRAANRGINPEIGLQLGGLSVKFHLLSLPTVVYIEHKIGIDEVKDGQ
ncbi:MAG: VOC family protein [Candidatus Saccharimonadales bacterium]